MSNFSSKTNFRAAVLAATGIMIEHSHLYAMGVQMNHETAPRSSAVEECSDAPPISPEPEGHG